MRALRWLIALMVTAGFVGVLASLRDPVRLQMGMWDITLSFGLLFFFLFALICFFILIDRLLQQGALFLRWRRMRQTHKARSYILGGLGSLAARDIVAAREAERKVDLLWHGEENDPFRLVFKGRLAEEAGENETAQIYYKELGRQKAARLFALRSQLRIAQNTHDRKMLRQLSAEVLKFAPDDLSLYDLRIEALRTEKQWGKAHDLLQKLSKRQLVAYDMVAGLRHDLYLQQSADLLQNGKTMQARHYARQAYKLQPDIHAVMAEIDGYVAANNPGAARKILAKIWKEKPDELLLPYWDRLAPHQNRFQFYQSMLKANAGSPLTHAALIQVAVEEHKHPEARAHLDALQKIPDAEYHYAQASALIARELDHDIAGSREWQNRADMLRAARRISAPVSYAGLRIRRLQPDAFE